VQNIAQKGHFVQLDGLRGIAALVVVAIHCILVFPVAPQLPVGHLAVDFFFMLSGFVVSYAYEEKLKTGMSVARFLRIRIIRLYPMIFIGVILGTLGRILDGAGGYQLPAIIVAAIFAFAMLPLPRASNDLVSAFPINGPLWSITYELASNVIYGILIKSLSVRACLIALIPLLFSLLLISYYYDGIKVGVTWGVGSALAIVRVICPFIIGVLIYRLEDKVRFEWGVLQYVLPIVLFVILVLPISDARVYDFFAVGIAFPLIIYLSARCGDGGPLRGIFSWLGNLSYPIYAINQPVFVICGSLVTYLGLKKDNPVVAAISVVLCLVIAQILMVFYDAPLRALLTKKFLNSDRTADGKR